MCIVYSTTLSAADCSTVNYCKMQNNKLECVWKEPERTASGYWVHARREWRKTCSQSVLLVC